MNNSVPKINVDILITKDNKILLGLLTKKWMVDGKQVYGVPGRDIKFNEKIAETVIRNVKEEIGCSVLTQKIICVNENFALGNHYVGIGVLAEINGEVRNLLPEDWEKWQWFEKDKIPDNLFPAAKNLLDCYFGNKFTVSQHFGS